MEFRAPIVAGKPSGKNSCRPKPIRRVEIPKPGSKEKRPPGIPAVIDRIMQNAVKMVVEPIFEREFAPNSYGFRPGRGCKDALREVERLLRSGRLHVVDVDIKGYFDNIPHQALPALVKERISDGRVLDLTEKFLKQGVMEEGIETEAEKGSPQGGVASPLPANIHLNPLNWLLKYPGLESVRYADDIVILARSAQQAKQAHESELGEMDGWVRMRLRSILRKRHKGKGGGRGRDHLKWPNQLL